MFTKRSKNLDSAKSNNSQNYNLDPINIARPNNPMSKSFEDLGKAPMMKQDYNDPESQNQGFLGPSFFFGTGFQGTSQIVESKDDANKGINYIILQNDEFHQKHEKYLEEIAELKSENEELENDNGSLESDKTRLKGLAINEAEKNNLYKKALVLYGTEISEKYKINKNLSHLILKIVLIIFVSQIVYLSGVALALSRTGHTIYSVPVIIGTFFTNILVILSAEFFVKPIYKDSSPFRRLQFWFFWNSDEMSQSHVRLNEILKEISEIEKGSGYLEQLIDH